jgi:restriction endonuclease Mrr
MPDTSAVDASDDLPSPQDLRWPALVALDRLGVESSILDLQERVCDRFGLTQEQMEAVDPATGRPELTERLVQALADLHAAGAVDATEGGALAITDAGRRMTEQEVATLPTATEEDPEGGDDERPHLRNYLRAVLDTLFEDFPGG